MPIIRVDYDGDKLRDDDVKLLAAGLQQIVSQVTGIKDVFVYANTAQVSLNIAPVEVFVEASALIFKDMEAVTKSIKNKLKEWKTQHKIAYPINLTLIPMQWKIEIGI